MHEEADRSDLDAGASEAADQGQAAEDGECVTGITTTGNARGPAHGRKRTGMQAARTQTGNVFRESASAIAAILGLHFPTGTIIDVNYGLGAFYRQTERAVFGIDLRPTGDIIADNRRLPLADDSFDVGVCDPPYKRGDGLKYEARYGKAPKTETQVTWSYHATLAELLRVCRRGVIIKVQDGTDGHRFHPRHITIAEWMKAKTGLEPHDIAVNARRQLAPTMAQGVPHFFQNGLSFFLVYAWRSKAPWRPIRF